MKPGVPGKIAVVIGTRPEAVKLAPVIRQLTARHEPPHVIVSGQHQELLDPTLADLGIKPSHRLQVMQPGQSLAKLSGALLAEIATHLDSLGRLQPLELELGATGSASAEPKQIRHADTVKASGTQNPRPEDARDPCWLVVQGDTATAAMAALAASYAKIPVAHVEAGLRTQNPRNPFPEEINRRLIADLAQLHFAPTSTALENLLREGIAGGQYNRR